MLLIKSCPGDELMKLTSIVMKEPKLLHLASFHELRTLRLCLAGCHHEGDAHQLKQSLALLHVLLPHLDAGLEKTRV
jgi:hypothetical protein